MQRTRAFGFFVRLLLGGAMAAGVLLVTAGDTAADQTTPPGKTVLGVACADIYALGIDRQANLRAAAIRVGCGLEKAGAPGPGSTEGEPATPTPGNVETITGREIYPHVTQSESSVWSSDGHTIVVNYNDSRTAPSNFSGVSVSSDGGATFARLNPSPLATGHGTNFGDPILVYNQKLAKWFAGDLATGCGGQGLGLWSSLDAYTWTVGACAHTGGNDDRESMWVDNTPTSPHYGRMYISFNNFNVGSGALQSTFSDDGVTWSAPVSVPGNTNFIRDVQLTGGPDGSVFIATMNEGGGGFANRQNFMYRSTDGGVTWTVNSGTMGAAFAPPGDLLCSSNSYFVNVAPIWRHMGWGQPGVGPGGVVHYAYAGKGGNSGDTGDIFYVRSTDNGSTWSAPIVLNTDQASGGNKTQWMPSLSVTAAGDVHAYWYDRRNTTDGVNYQVWGRISHDNGATWQPDQPVSSLLLVIPQPEQPDPNIQACYAGDYNYATAYGNTHYATWNDGRVKVSDGSLLHSQQDVFFAAIPGKPPEFLIDFDGDAHGDILFRSTNGSLMEWQMLGSTPGAQIKAQETFATVTTDWTIQDTGDFDGDGKSDILWRRTDGTYALWLMDGFNVKSANVLGVIGNEWQTAGVGDFDGDGKSDILFRRNTDGLVYLLEMDGFKVKASAPLGSVPTEWQLVGIGDFDGDGKSDILFRRNTDGAQYLFEMDGFNVKASGFIFAIGTEWHLVGIGDFDGDGKSDLLYTRSSDGTYQLFEMDGFNVKAAGFPFSASTDLAVAEVADINGDGKADIVFHRASDGCCIVTMNGLSILDVETLPAVTTDYSIIGHRIGPN